MHPVSVQRVVVVGAGLAGGRAVQELRAQGFDGEVVLLGAEPHLPYDRPPLSKQVLLGQADSSPLEGPWEADVRLGVRATGLRPGVVETDTGEVPYDGLVLACGSVAVNPWVGGHVLRTLDDALSLRALITTGAHVVIVGAGWIGAEVATAAVARGATCTVVEAAAHPLAVALGGIGALTVPWYDECGVELRLASPVAGVDAESVTLTSGGRLTADVVVVGIGARPDTGWLTGSGLVLDRGVVVDQHLATSWPGVVAVGDCTARWSPRFGARLRVEHWDDALQGPTAAVATLLGTPTEHDPVPYFWSEQLGHRLQHVGHAEATDRVVHRGSPGDADGWGVAWLRGERLTAYLAVDRPRDLAQARKRVGEPIDPELLADPDVPLRSA